MAYTVCKTVKTQEAGYHMNLGSDIQMFNLGATRKKFTPDSRTSWHLAPITAQNELVKYKRLDVSGCNKCSKGLYLLICWIRLSRFSFEKAKKRWKQKKTKTVFELYLSSWILKYFSNSRCSFTKYSAGTENVMKQNQHIHVVISSSQLRFLFLKLHNDISLCCTEKKKKLLPLPREKTKHCKRGLNIWM